MNPRQKLLNQFSTLSPELMRSAQFILDNEQELIVLSMRAFAQKANVLPATLLRLAKSLGYTGWNEFKDEFITLKGLRDNPYTSKAQDIINRLNTHDDPSDNLYDKFFEAQIQNLILTQQKNKHVFSTFIDIVDTSKHLYICGFRGSFPIAWSVYYVYRLFKKNITLIDGLALNLEMHKRDFTAEDTIIVVGFAPYSQETISIIRAAQKASSRILAVTDSLASPLAQSALSSLIFSTDGPSFFPSISSGISISEGFLAGLLAKYGQTGVNNLELNEKFLLGSGAYFNDQ